MVLIIITPNAKQNSAPYSANKQMRNGTKFNLATRLSKNFLFRRQGNEVIVVVVF